MKTPMSFPPFRGETGPPSPNPGVLGDAGDLPRPGAPGGGAGGGAWDRFTQGMDGLLG